MRILNRNVRFSVSENDIIVSYVDCAAVWLPKHVLDRPKPPTREEREAELALLEAQARAGQGTNDPRAKSRVKVRPAVLVRGAIV
jgi:hypothetical protein